MPRTKQRFEQYFTTKLIQWLKYFAHDLHDEFGKNVGPIEAKVSYKTRFNFAGGFKKDQLKTLIKAKYGTVIHKISDLGRINARPWDIDCYTESMSVVALMWKRDNNKVFYLFDPEVINNMIRDGVKSIDEKEAAYKCFKIGYLRK
jgi:hypothetical protein